MQEALESPVTIEQDSYDTDLIHALWPVPEKGFRVLRVIYNEAVTSSYRGHSILRYDGESSMKLEFDPSADAAYFEISSASVERTEEIEPGINADYDSEGHLVGIEVLSVSKRNLTETFGKVA